MIVSDVGVTFNIMLLTNYCSYDDGPDDGCYDNRARSDDNCL